MKKRILLLILTIVCSISVAAQQRPEPLNNQAVIKLVRAGFKEKTVIAIIRSKPPAFDLSPERLIELKKNGVSEQVILAMVAHEGMSGGIEPDVEDDTFFGDMTLPKPTGNGAGKTGDTTDIFGSSGGSRSRTRNQGPGGENTEDSQTTGSATVKIIRPPSESGDAPKLEKTPTLTNSSIVDLVDAGFSEGTIVRRIELSPAEFDLSPAKITELKSKRVSDRVIAAMTAAMGGEDPAGKGPAKAPGT